MPIVIVGYSGGFVPAAWSLEVAASATACAACSCSTRCMASSTSSHPGLSTTGPAFLSAPIRVTPSATIRTDADAERKRHRHCRGHGWPLRPGSVVFVETPEGVTASRLRHRTPDASSRSKMAATALRHALRCLDKYHAAGPQRPIHVLGQWRCLFLQHLHQFVIVALV